MSPATVRLIETDTSATWSMYKVNDAYVHIKPSTAPRANTKDGSKVWQFTFSTNELKSIAKHSSNVVLVCAIVTLRQRIECGVS